MQRRPYFVYIVREATSTFVAAYLIFFLMMHHRLSQGPAAYESSLETQKSPLAILLHLVALALALFHTITWFGLTPKELAVWKGDERVPDHLLIIPNYVIWILISAVVWWFVLKS